MAANKNTLSRIFILDKLLADRYHSYSIGDMTEIINRELADTGAKKTSVTKRCVEKDINYLETQFPELIDIERYQVDAYSPATDKAYKKRCVRYEDPAYSIFNEKLSEEEKELLSTALSILGSFDGLECFEKLNDLKSRVGLVEKKQPVIQLSKNLTENSTKIAELFSAIRSRTVVKINYKLFNASCVLEVVFCPYHLKEYNRRWFLIGAAYDTGKILNFALDRIEELQMLPGYKYRSAPEDLLDRFEDIIGVTYKENTPVYKIIFWAGPTSAAYIRTKPLHGSQKEIRRERAAAIVTEYALPAEGAIFSIECMENYELIRELTSFEELRVLSPEPIIQSIKERIRKISTNYKN